MKKFFKSKLLLQVVVSCFVATLATAGMVGAATTIGANITTTGTLAVTGASTLTGATSVAGALNASSTLMVTGAVTTYGAVTLGDAATDTVTIKGKTKIGTDTSTNAVSLANTAGSDFGLETYTKLATDMAGGWYAGSNSYMTVPVTQTGNTSVFGSISELDLGTAITFSSSNAGAMWADLEILGATNIGASNVTTPTYSGAVIATVIGPATMTVPTYRQLAGVLVDSNLTAGYTNNGTVSGVLIRKSSGKDAWPYGLKIEDSASTIGIDIGTSTTDIVLQSGETIDNVTDGVITLSGIASTTSLTLLNGETITNATDGVIQLNGAASTTSLTLLNGESITNATDGVIQLNGIASTTSITLLNGETITNATDGKILFTSDAGAVTGEAHGISLTFTGETSSGDSLVGINSVVTPTGTGANWTAGVFGNVTQGATKTNDGYITGGEFEVINACSTASGIFPITLDAGGSVAYDAQSSFIFLNDWGTSKLGSLLRFGDPNSPYTTSDTAIFTTRTADSTATHAIRFVGPDNTPYWIMVTTDTPAD